MLVDNWNIPNCILDWGKCSHDHLNHYKNRIDMLHGIAKGRAVSTRANRKEQVDALKKAPDLNHTRDIDDKHDNNDFNSNPDSGSPLTSKTQMKSFPINVFVRVLQTN